MADTTARSRAGRAEARPDKVSAVAEMSAAFRSSTAALLTEYRGLTMAQLTELRRSLGSDTTYSVVKNTLTLRAAADAGLTLDALLTGPTAIAFVAGDPVHAAKGVRDFSRTHPLLVIKGAVLDGKFLSADEVRQLADLESREVLLARFAGAMQASLSQVASLLQAPLSQAARLVAALQDQRSQGAAPAETAPADTAPADTALSDTAPAETAPAETAPGDTAAPDAESPSSG